MQLRDTRVGGTAISHCLLPTTHRLFVFNSLQPLFRKHPGGGVPRIPFQPPTAHYQLLTTHSPPESSRVARCAALAVEEAPAGDSGKRGGACLRPRRWTLCGVHRFRCFLSPATHTEPPAGVLAGLPVAAMPTRNSSTLPTGRPYSQLCVLCASVVSPMFTVGAPNASAPRPPAWHLPGPPRTRCRLRLKTPSAAHRLRRNSFRRSAPS